MRTQFTIKRIFVLLLPAVLMISGCGEKIGNSLNTKRSDDALVVMLFDISGSTALEKNSSAKSKANNINRTKRGSELVQNQELDGMRKAYLEKTKEILEKLGPGTSIRGIEITEKPLSITDIPIKAELPEFDEIFGRKPIHEAMMVRVREETGKKVEELLKRSDSILHTCIMDTLLVAANTFKDNPKSNKILIIFSDMIEECGDQNSKHSFDFAKSPPKDSTATLQKISDDRLPKLPGVIVYVFGPTGGVGEADSVDRYIMIQSFWEAFFNRVNAKMKRYGRPLEFP